MHKNKFTESKRILYNQLKFKEKELDYTFLPIELSLYVKTKNYKKFENKLKIIDKKINEQEDQSKLQNSLKCVYYLFMLSFYYNLNH